MRILQVHNYYQQPGGEDTVVASEEKLLTRRGHQVSQYLLHNESISGHSKFQVAVDTLWNKHAYRAVRQRIEKQGIELLHVHNTFPLVSPSVYYAAQAEGVPVVQTLHNYRLLCPASTFFRDNHLCEDCLAKHFPWPAIQHRCYRHSIPASALAALMLAAHRTAKTYSSKVAAYITFNRFSLEKFVEGGLPRDRLRIKPNFVLADPGLGSGYGGYALFAGRLVQEKGVRTLLNAWSGLSLPLKIAGDGPLREAVQSAAKANPSVEYLGQCSHDHLNDLMRNAAVLLFPSEWYEGSPMAVIESMACGTPVLASDCGSLKEMIVPGENGLLFPTGNAKDLAVSVTRLFSEASPLNEMRYATRQYYESHFAAGPNYETLLNIYQQAARPSPLT